MLERVHGLRPDARLEGFSVQSMAVRPHARELIVGASIDAVFGPVLLFGAGGTAVEVLADRAIALPPLNRPLAAELVGCTRVARLLAGYRDRPPADLDAIHAVLVAVSQMLADLPEIAELDINPLLADEHGVLALDARVRLSALRPAGAAHFAIKPYPQELVQHLRWDGRDVVLRPIRPGDEAQHLAFLSRLDPEDVRMRVFQTRRELPKSELARLTQIDYAREMALILVTVPREAAEESETLGVVRAIADPDNIEAEFAIVVRSDLKGRDMGRLLMDRIIDYARGQGTRWLVGDILRENKTMLALALALGFAVESARSDGEAVHVRLGLQAAPA
jgi:acetyltransferase